MLIAEEEHEGDRIVEFVHLLEVFYFVDVANIDDGEVLHNIGDLVEHLILTHAVGLGLTTEANDHQSLVLRQDCLVDVPGGDKVRKDDGTHVATGTLLLEVLIRVCVTKGVGGSVEGFSVEDRIAGN